MKNHFQIIKNFKIFGIISILICAAGLAGLLSMPFGAQLFNLSIDFVGGTQMEFNMKQTVTQEVANEVSKLYQETTGVKGTVTAAGDTSEQAVIRSTSIDSETRDKVIEAMEKQFSLTDDDLYKNEDVSPSVGNDLKAAAILTAIITIILMLLYIAFRFELASGLAAVVCLVHDLCVMMTIFVIFRIPVTVNFIAAALTILGYSINASIIVFDRIRENLRTAGKEAFEDVAERSVWQTMGRTINTTVTTLLTVGMIYILGVTSLKEFTLPLIVGIVAGAYSSIFLSSALWGKFRKLFKKKRV